MIPQEKATAMMKNTVDILRKSGYNGLAVSNASVAQSVVHLTRNEKVACSSQVTSSKNPTLTGLDFLFFCNKTVVCIVL